jgi:hypothetical protein
MRQLYVCAIMFVMLFTFSSCQKGEQGPEGKQGIQGIKGADGKTILSGEGAPAMNVGAIGDFYIDTKNLLFFGPKSDNSWGVGSALKSTDTTNNLGATTYLKEDIILKKENISKLNGDFIITTEINNIKDLSDNSLVFFYMKHKPSHNWASPGDVNFILKRSGSDYSFSYSTSPDLYADAFLYSQIVNGVLIIKFKIQAYSMLSGDDDIVINKIIDEIQPSFKITVINNSPTIKL